MKKFNLIDLLIPNKIVKDKRGSPVVEEGLLIGIAIVGILIFIGLIFGLFDWINEALSSLFDSFNLSLFL
jgi:galactitol-specific phosphotransferase system IIC component